MKSAWSSSVSPLIAGLITASVFVAGAGAFELGRATAIEPAAPVNTEPAEDPIEFMPSQPALSEWPVPPVVVDNRPMVVLVIDDAGIDPELTRQVLELPAALTISFLPYAEESPALAELAEQHGHDIFLHLPMEPYGLEDPGPGALTRHLSPDEMQARINHAFQRLPAAIGFNNHMGSAFTADASAVTTAFAGLEGRELIFLDSLTSGNSQAFRIASDLGLTALRRDVFIDHIAGQERVFLDEMARRARAEGSVIAIAHPRRGTLEALTGWLAEPENQDVQFVTIRQFLTAQTAGSVVASGETVGLLGSPE